MLDILKPIVRVYMLNVSKGPCVNGVVPGGTIGRWWNIWELEPCERFLGHCGHELKGTGESQFLLLLFLFCFLVIR
jgi:hypothetical protein